MRKIVAAMNMTIDGVCDHTQGLPDEELHNYYTALLNSGDAILYGRTTYELMQFWQTILETPSEKKSMNDFAEAIDRIPKIVFSSKLNNTGWHNAKLTTQSLEKTVTDLKQQSGNDIFIGSRSLIVQLANLNLIDEYKICIQPVVAGKGLLLFDGIDHRKIFKLIQAKSFISGTILLHYQRT